MISKETRERVISLRREGKTFNLIHNLLGVAKSSISDICRPLGLGGNQECIELTLKTLDDMQQKYILSGSLKKVVKEFNTSYERIRDKIHLIHTPRKVTKTLSVINWRKKVKLLLIEYKGGKCLICGYNKCTSALEFHHLNPTEKDFLLSGKSKSFKNLVQEADKCILVCANCHREIHSGIISQDMSSQIIL